MKVIKIADDLSAYEREAGVNLVPPVNGHLLSFDEYLSINSKRLAVGEDLLTHGEIGCTKAHLNAYRLAIGLASPCLIVESDIALSANSINILMQAVKILKPDFLHLAHYTGYPFFVKPVRCPVLAAPVFKVNPYRKFFGSAAYYISLGACKSLLDFHSNYLKRADDWSVFFRDSSFDPLYCPIFLHPWMPTDLAFQRASRPSFTVRKTLARKTRTFFFARLPSLFLFNKLSGFSDSYPQLPVRDS